VQAYQLNPAAQLTILNLEFRGGLGILSAAVVASGYSPAAAPGRLEKKMNYRLLLSLPLATALVLGAACTTTDEIIIDKKGVNMTRYEQDLAECRAYATEVKTGEKAARGAVSGAVVGGAIGAVVDGSEGAGRGAGVGAISGGARGANQGGREEVQVVKNCLRGRGYRILN
jgi:outer membrane lipoprotein SlyB